ncbi:histidine triad family protein [Stylonychia lemnae]|uniref:Histidine triad family protein n=1 Tax=Stylonychia lemnae TaxID=5949 RepID=A0A078B692_STYLE|nr:histidine triad family protein [Stylonychia lemnae]|eukprot:CDW88832.1 histidine triad family protein [Stylonychia lemnae]
MKRVKLAVQLEGANFVEQQRSKERIYYIRQNYLYICKFHIKDEKIIIVADIKPRAETHLQCIPKRHIRDISFLRPNQTDISLLEHMFRIGSEYLYKHHPNIMYHKRYLGDGLTKYDELLSELIFKQKKLEDFRGQIDQDDANEEVKDQLQL